MNSYVATELKNIELFDQNVSLKNIEVLYNILYNNIQFSTFPYILYKETKSEECIKKYNSGNCIGISKFIQLYLQENYHIKSFLIPASVPQSCKVIGTAHLSHVAVLVPISKTEFYIIDCALYFVNPIYCNVTNNIKRHSYLTDVYEYENRKINYIIKPCNERMLDDKYNQEILSESLCVNCEFDELKSENWNYYLNEILNPDFNIGYLFLQSKKNPFLMLTSYNNNKVKMIFKLTVDLDNNKLRIVDPANKKTLYDDKPDMNVLSNFNIDKYLLNYIT